MVQIGELEVNRTDVNLSISATRYDQSVSVRIAILFRQCHYG
jgi:hypothetical protein